jgi:NAD(P)-dependent dehydrogenase (short-subunit alcohol dehydrogenase family)
VDIAIVTGAYKGLGFEWCKQLARLGYKVVLTARDLDKAKQASEVLNEQDLVVYPRKLDITSPTNAQELFNWCSEKFGRVDLIINNAGVNSGTRAKGDRDLQQKNLSIECLDKHEVLSMLDINSISPILFAQTFRPLLSNSVHPKVINIGSWLGSISVKKSGGNYSYAVSKSALNMMNRAFAFDVVDDNIISVVVNPGWVQTDMGGLSAEFTKEQAVSNLIRNVMEKISIQDTAKFLNYDGSEHPW